MNEFLLPQACGGQATVNTTPSEKLSSAFPFFTQGPVARRPISANPWLDFNSGSFFLKTFSWIIFPILFRLSSRQIVDKKNSTEFAF